MSDSSNDGSKDFDSSEVSSTCNVGRQNQSSAAAEGASTSDAPIPRSLSPDTSEAANAAAVSQGDDLTSTTNEPRQEDAKSTSSEEYLDADVSGNVTGSNERSWTGEEPPASSSREQQEGPAVSESSSKPWNMLVSYESTSEEEEDQVPQPAPVSESAETREISTTQTPNANVSPNNGQNVTGSGDAVREEGASSSEMRLEGSSVSGSHDFNIEGEAGSSSNVLEDITEGQEEEQLTSSGNGNNNDGVESSRLNQPELEAEEEEEEEILTSSGHEAEAAVVEPEPTATVSGSDDLQREPRVAVLSSSSNNIIASLLTAERPASSEADPLGQPQDLAIRPDSPSGRTRPEVQPGGSRSLENPLAQVAPSVAPSEIRVEEEAVAARRLVSSATQPRPPMGMSVLAQQLRVSSAGQGHSSLMRQLISSHNESGVSNR